MKKIAVIFGGYGFIGSQLARQLMTSGSESRVVCADIAASPRFRTDGVEYIFCDVRNEIASDLVSDVTEIYNLAAVHTTPGHEDWEYFWTNVMGASRVCDYARRAGVETIVFTSSISVYGASEEELSEKSLLQPETAYGRSKLCAETVHHLWRDEAPEQRRLLVARPAVIFGYTERGNFTRLARMLMRRCFLYSGRKDTIKACGYVKDLVASFGYFLAQPIGQVTYNFAYTERLTIENICHTFRQVAGYGLPIGVIPMGIMLLGAVGFELLGKLGLKTSVNRARIMKLFRSTNIIPQRLDESGFVRRFNLADALVDWRKDSGGKAFE